MNDSIKKMLRLINQNLVITEVTYKLFQNKKKRWSSMRFSLLLLVIVHIAVPL